MAYQWGGHDGSRRSASASYPSGARNNVTTHSVQGPHISETRNTVAQSIVPASSTSSTGTFDYYRGWLSRGEALKESQRENEELKLHNSALLEENKKLRDKCATSAPGLEEDHSGMEKIKTMMRQLYQKIEELEQKKTTQITHLKQDLEKRRHPALIDSEANNQGQLARYKEALKSAEETESKLTNMVSQWENKAQEAWGVVEHLKKENEELSQRLSLEMNTKVSADESNMENISVKNRPMNLVGEYSTFCTTEWLELKEAIDEGLKRKYQTAKDRDIIQFMCDITQKAEKKAQEFLKKTTDDVKDILEDPFGSSYNRKRATTKCPPMMVNAIGDYLRSSADTTDMSKLIENTRREAKSPYDLVRLCEYLDPYDKYINVAVRLSWKMVNQRPPMTFQTPGTGELFDETKQELGWGSLEPSATTNVDCYVYPALYQGGKILAKGKVLLKEEEVSGGKTTVHVYKKHDPRESRF